MKYWFGSVHIIQKPLKRPIVIFSSRRSGSTLLAEMIGSEKGINVSDQPFDLWHFNPYSQRLPNPYLNKFVDLTPEEETLILHYSRDLFAGKIRVYTRWKLWDPDYNFVVNRMVFKILSAKYLMDWFDENFDIDVIYQLRHPIPYALSVIRLNWGCTAEAFLRSDAFVKRFLDSDKLEACHYFLEHGTPLQKHVLEWGLENVFPLSIFKARDWLTLTYEELVMRPEQSCKLLAERFSLTAREKMIRHISNPSVSTTNEYSSEQIKRGNADILLKRWIDKVDPGEAKEAIDILKQLLDINVYSWNSPFPSEMLCQFGAFE